MKNYSIFIALFAVVLSLTACVSNKSKSSNAVANDAVAGVYIYVNSVEKSAESIIKLLSETDGKLIENIAPGPGFSKEIAIEIPYKSHEELIKLLTENATNKTVYGMKTIIFAEENLKEDGILFVRIHLTDVKALKPAK